VAYSTTGGTAVAGSHYFATSGVAAFAAGQTAAAVISVTWPGGWSPGAEGDRTVEVTLSNPTCSLPISGAVGVLTIQAVPVSAHLILGGRAR
jgi:hypothetical protein